MAPILADSVTVCLSIFAVLTGLVFGSFLNVCVSRLPRHESVVWPRSRCPVCLTPIRNIDNIPVLSYLLLKGRCRGCGARIPLRYPLIEVATAALFLLCFLVFGFNLVGVAAAIFCWLLLGLTATDAETMLLPDSLTLPGLAFGVVYSGVRDAQGRFPAFSWKAAGLSLLWAACASALILLIRAIYQLVRRREGIGLGDAKLLAMIAAWLGLRPTALALFLGILSAAAYGAVWIAIRDQSTSRRNSAPGESSLTRIPLGAFLCAAAIFVLFRGEAVISWYLSFWP